VPIESKLVINEPEV